jgi:enoyl-CoA hydratase/carnithine racemase
MDSELRKRIHTTIMSKSRNNVIVRKNEATLEVVLNRPEKRNAFSLNMYLEVAEAIRQANRDTTIKYILITGDGKTFSSGNDLTSFGHPDYAEFEIRVYQ